MRPIFTVFISLIMIIGCLFISAPHHILTTGAEAPQNQTIDIQHGQHFNEGTQSWWHEPDCGGWEIGNANITRYQILEVLPWTTTTTSEVDSQDDLGNPIVSYVNSTSSGTNYTIPLSPSYNGSGECLVLWQQPTDEPDENYYPTLAALQLFSGENS